MRISVSTTFACYCCDWGSLSGYGLSHHVFRKEGVQERLNLQRDGSHAKPYQVRQVRRVILRYRLEGED